MFPNTDAIWFEKPLDVSKYVGYDCADMTVGLDLKNNKIICTDGDWMSCQTSYSFDNITKYGLKDYYKKLLFMSKDDFVIKNIWTREYSENYYEKIIKSGKNYDEVFFQCAFI